MIGVVSTVGERAPSLGFATGTSVHLCRRNTDFQYRIDSVAVPREKEYVMHYAGRLAVTLAATSIASLAFAYGSSVPLRSISQQGVHATSTDLPPLSTTDGTATQPIVPFTA